ncbi:MULTISPECIES: MlaD family protein [Protofrankia]|uniref:Mammalian cell entry related domain protein n=1 Tax=Candidatus Protofrankia datiscae TaxID=2716812 RepID=F8AY51_9ACTN|nr:MULTISPECIES: MlaD family protein [Protofrankia]AEH09481.1 Mammalian cell entry related domain protein [Candidatus Protofrankia datiscae]
MTTPELRARTRSFRAGFVVLAILAVVLYLTFKAQTGLPFAPTTTASASFGNIHSLRVNDDVREMSKRIGRVSKIDYVNGVALVTMELDGNVKVYQDAHAEIWDVSALASKFVELDRGTQRAGELGGRTIEATRNVDSADLYQLLDVLDQPTRDAATRTIRALGGGAAGHSDDLQDLLKTAPDLLEDIGTVSQALASEQADLPTLLQDVDRLAGRLSDRQQEIASLVSQSDTTLRAVSVDGGKPLTNTLERLPATLDTAKHALDSLNTPLADTASAVRDLEPGAGALARSETDVRGVLVEGVPVAGKVPGVAEQAVPAVEDLTHTVSDARPLASPLRRAISDLNTPLRVLAPYAPEIGQLFVRGQSFVSEGPVPGVRYARLSVNPGLATVTNGLLPSGNYAQNQYPRPGEASSDRAQGLPSGIPLVGGTR